MTEKNKEKKQKNNKMKYPIINIEEALELSSRLVRSYSRGHFTQPQAATTIGYESSPKGSSAIQRIATLTYYGLLVKSQGQYNNSEVAYSIAYPDSTLPEQRKHNIVRTVKNINLFATLINQFIEQPIPEELKNTLITQYRINDNIAGKVAQNFEDSIKFAGMYDEGIITDPSRNAEPEKSDDQPASQSNSLTSQQKNLAQQQSTDTSMTDIPLARGVKVLFPDDLKLFLAVGKFANGIEALKQDIKALDEKNGGEGAQHNEKGKDTPAEPSSLREELEQGE